MVWDEILQHEARGGACLLTAESGFATSPHPVSLVAMRPGRRCGAPAPRRPAAAAGHTTGMMVVAMCVWALCAGVLVAGEADRDAPLADARLTTNVQIAPLADLKPESEASRALGELLPSLLTQRWAVQKRVNVASSLEVAQRLLDDARRAELRCLAQFAGRFPASTEALRAKFLVGKVVLDAGYYTDACPCLQDVADLYPGTVESALARVALLELDFRRLAKQNDRAELGEGPPIDRREARRVAERQKAALEEALPFAAQLDVDRSQGVKAYRRLLMGEWRAAPEGLLAASVRQSIADNLEILGRYEEARGIYRSIMRDHPGTQTAWCAERSLEMSEDREKTGWRQPGQFLGHATKERARTIETDHRPVWLKEHACMVGACIVVAVGLGCGCLLLVRRRASRGRR